MKDLVKIRAAVQEDVDSIFELLELYVSAGIVLRRSKENISFFIGNFIVAEIDGKVCGCAALRDFGSDLLELRSVVISPDFQGKGVGRGMVESLIASLSKGRTSWRLFTLTTTPAFFKALGFKVVPKEKFPEKIWSDCAQCPKFDSCDEIALEITS